MAIYEVTIKATVIVPDTEQERINLARNLFADANPDMNDNHSWLDTVAASYASEPKALAELIAVARTCEESGQSEPTAKGQTLEFSVGSTLR